MSPKIEEFYKTILKGHGIFQEIQKVEVISPEFSGDNFGSKTETVTIHFVDNLNFPPLELFVKKAIQNNEYATMLEDMEVFEREVIFFNSILDDLNQFCRQKLNSSQYFHKMLPKVYYADNELVIMENLIKNGYLMKDKKVFHDDVTSRKVMQILGKFHAVSYAMIKEKGRENLIKKYPTLTIANGWSKLGEKLNSSMVTSIIGASIKALKAYSVQGAEEALKYLSGFESNTYFKICRHYNFKNEACALVLNHGDFWNCNVLFKEEEKPLDLEGIMIDFQTIHFGSPVLDLQYYMYMSLKSVGEKWRELLQIYFETFQQNVSSLKTTLDFTFEDLVLNFRERCEAGLVFGLYLVFGWVDGGDIQDPQTFEGSPDDYFNSAIDSKVDTLIHQNGQFYAKQIVQVYQEFNNIVNSRD